SGVELRVRTADGSHELRSHVRSTKRGGRDGHRWGTPSVWERGVNLKVSNVRKLTNSPQESADRDHPADRYHVLSARQFHDGELEPGAHERHQSEPAHGRVGPDAIKARLHQRVGR